MSKYAQQAKATKKKRKVSKLGKDKPMSDAQKAKLKKASLLGKGKPMSDAQKTLRQQRLRKQALTKKQEQLPTFIKKKIMAKKGKK